MAAGGALTKVGDRADDWEPQAPDVLAALREPPRPSDLEARPRIGVVFGAGGVQGNAYLAGAVAALALETGFEPRRAHVLVGTSAGSVHAALFGGGLPALFPLWRNRGGRLPDDLQGPPDATAPLGTPTDAGEAHAIRRIFAPARGLPRIGPASGSLVLRALLRPWAHRPEVVLSALLPEGLLTNVAIGEELRRIVTTGWVAHPRTWITAVNLRNGTLTVFGRPDAPRAELDRAVRASCAIPGIYRPVRIGDDRYVDGGVHSPSNADLVAHLDLDLVVVLNPMSALDRVGAVGVVDRTLSRLRDHASARLAAELRRLQEADIPTLVVQPGARDLDEFTHNLMDPRPRRRVAETALETTRAFLQRPEAARARTLLRVKAAAGAAKGTTA